MIDIASEDRDEIPMDLPEYIKESYLARAALRRSRKMEEIERKSEVISKLNKSC
ncbi:hypothetical protein CFOLD11_11580 [Clostridium folliculivorans]|uniref:Uncharacterized protein n=1 Tax=Clostridium folliculivorans TaxID=2886038 RepID=A0A9W6DA08_9CLOT|nr:hypothetical protein CFOLD11_11580 [Clostridium folliculivorans]